MGAPGRGGDADPPADALRHGWGAAGYGWAPRTLLKGLRMAAPAVTSGLHGQRHLVVGAANGIGEAIARRLADLGAHVVCLDLDGARAAEVAADLPGDGPPRSYELDVRSEASVADAFARVADEVGDPHALVNCAGVTGTTGINTHEVDVDDFDNTYRVNLRGAFLVSRAVLPLMLAGGYGRLLHIASISGKEGNAGMAAYSTTKAGLIGLVKVMGKEYANTNVTINALAPAVIRTKLVDAMPEAQVRYMTDKIPMGRTGTLDEVADLAAWIVSPACSFTTGFAFDLSGGRAVY